MHKIFVDKEMFGAVTKIIIDKNFDIGYAIINEQQIDGYVFYLNDEQLWQMDRFFLTPIYVRKEVSVHSKEMIFNAYYYIQENNNYHFDFYNADIFNHLIGKNKLGKYDLHLLFPCSLYDFNEMQESQAPSDFVVQFLNSLRDRNDLEFKGDFVKKLSRYFLGYYSLYVYVDGEVYSNACMVTLSKHENTNVGVMNISIIAGTVPGHYILEDFCGRILGIGDQYTKIEEWCENKGIKICGSPRSVIFTQDKIEEESILNALISEANPSGKINGIGFTKKLNENLAQYNTATVYASEVALIELEKFNQNKLNVVNRVSNQTVELFFIELLLLQDAAISRINTKILFYLEHEIKNKALANDNILDDLVCESAQAILFFDLNEFLFPTVRLSAEKVADCFGIERQMENYEKYKDILGQLIAIRDERQERIKNSSLNTILLFLAIAQVLPLFITAFRKVMYAELTVDDLIISLMCFAASFTIWLVFRIMTSIHYKANSNRKKRGKAK